MLQVLSHTFYLSHSIIMLRPKHFRIVTWELYSRIIFSAEQSYNPIFVFYVIMMP